MNTFTTVDFRPAPPGWKLLVRDPDNPHRAITRPMPGWLIIDEDGEKYAVVSMVDTRGVIYDASGDDILQVIAPQADA